MLYDTHCHPYLATKKDQEHILENFFLGGGIYLNSIACDTQSSQTCIDLAKKYTGVYASIGIHPTHTLEYHGKLEETILKIESLYKSNTFDVVAIGECGLDYYWLGKLSETSGISEDEIIVLQKHFFIAQIHLAHKLGLPLIIHNREASVDIFKILQETGFRNFVFHCFSENYDFAKKLIDFAPNCKLGFGGITTFKNATSIQDTVKKVPLENIIIETDSPYLTPTPHRGKQENEPLYTQYVLDTIVELRDEDPEYIKNILFENSKDFFLRTSV